MDDRRQQKRFLKRCSVRFSTNEREYGGQSTNFSLDGLFIETDHPFTGNTSVDIVVYLPDGSASQLQGKVVRASKLPFRDVMPGQSPPREFMKASADRWIKGMGVSLVNKDPNYLHLIRSLLSDKTACPWRIQSQAEFDTLVRPEGKTPQAAHGKFEAFARDMRRKSQLVTVVYQNNKCGLVESSLLDELIASRRVKKFLRSDGWVTLGVSPLRGSS